MTRYSRGVVWFNRTVLAAVTFVMTMIAMRSLRDPIGSTLPIGIALGSPSAVTVVRVGFGGFPLGFAVALFACLIAQERLLAGMSLVLAVVGGATAARIQGLLLDGATPYNVALLRPEIVMLVLSALGIVLEVRRRRSERAA
jgi:fucose permease